MSRLLNPGLGDFADRLSILNLKIDHGEKFGKPVIHLRLERTEVLKQIVGFNRASDARWETLHTVNQQIWELISAIEFLGKYWPKISEADAYAIAGAAVELQGLNRQRAELVRQISGPETPKEKW